MAMPNFIMIGAGKSGTTSLAHYLSKHPDVFVSKPKEPRFFAYAGRTPDFRGPRDSRLVCLHEQNDYERLFDETGDAKAIGEASTWYLTSSEAPANIKRLAPEARLIAVLRNPVERAFSHWMHLMREQIEPIDDFQAACAAEPGRIAANWSPHWHYVRQSRYFEGLKRYFDLFDRRQIGVFLYEDFQADPHRVVDDICELLGVTSGLDFDAGERLNVGGLPRVKWLQRYLDNSLWGGEDPFRLAKKLVPTAAKRAVKQRLTEANLTKPIDLTDEARAELLDMLRPDIDKLETLIGRDLSAWKDGGPPPRTPPDRSDLLSTTSSGDMA